MRRRKPEVIEWDAAEVAAIVERTQCALDAKDYEKLRATVETCFWMMAELEKKNATLARLRKDLSINTKKTEKTSTVLKGAPSHDEESGKKRKKKKKPRGHGRHGADAYEGAEKIAVPHTSLKSGDSCPECEKGKLSVLRVPSSWCV